MEVSIDNLLTELKELRKNFRTPERVPLTTVPDHNSWHLSGDGTVRNLDNSFFKVELRLCQDDSREISKPWVQPFITQNGFDGGILGQLYADLPNDNLFLVQLKYEGGNYKGWQITTTVQATFENLRAAHKGRSPHFANYFWDGASEIVDQRNRDISCESWLAEDGGRLFLKRNRAIISSVQNYEKVVLPRYYHWVSFSDLEKLLFEDAVLSPHLMRIMLLFKAKTDAP